MNFLAASDFKFGNGRVTAFLEKSPRAFLDPNFDVETDGGL